MSSYDDTPLAQAAITAVQVRHGGAVRTVRLRLETAPASPPKDQRTLTGRQPLQGATVVNLSPAVADEYGLDPFLHGVIIVKLNGGIAARVGFRPGDIVRRVNGRGQIFTGTERRNR